MAKTVWISLRKIKLHELRTTLRYLQRHDEKWSDLYLRLGELVSESTATSIKTGSSLLLYYFLLSSISDPYEMSVTFQGVTASVPTSFPLIIACITFYFFTLQFQTALMLIGFRASQSSKVLLRGFSANAFGFIMKQDQMALVTPLHNNGFLKERLGVSSLLTFFTTVVAATLLLPILGLFFFLCQKTFTVVLADDASLLNLGLGFVCISILSATLLFVFLFNLPIPMKRNSFSIRFGLLTNLYPVGQHPRVATFLKDAERRPGVQGRR